MAASKTPRTWDELRDIYEHMKKTIPERPTDPRGDYRTPRQRRDDKLFEEQRVRLQRRREWEKRVREAIRLEELEREEDAAAIRRRDRLNKAKAASESKTKRLQWLEDRFKSIQEEYKAAIDAKEQETIKTLDAEIESIIMEIKREKNSSLRLW